MITRLHMLTLATLVGLMIAPTGCYYRYDIKKTTRGFKVSTSPPGAFVWKQDHRGRHTVGQAPQTLEIPYERKIRRPNKGAMVLHTLISTAMVVAGAALLASADTTGADMDGGALAGGILGISVGASYALTNFIFLLTFGSEIDITPVRPLMIGASKPGYADAWRKVVIPDKGATSKRRENLHLRLMPAGGPMVATTVPSNRPRPADRPIVAVFALEDASGRLTAKTAEELAQYLAIQVTATGVFRTIPRAQLRKKLSTAKKEGYKDCYEQACQIELGKALAAQKSLSTKVLAVGKVCTITSVLFDLKTETSEGAATAETGCSTAELLKGLRQVAKELAKSR